MQIIAACKGVDVDDFSGKIEMGDKFRLHRLGIDLLDRYAAGRDDGFLNRTRARHRQRQGLESIGQILPLFPGNLIDRTVPGDAGLVEDDGDEPLWQEILQGVRCFLADVLLKVPPQPGIELFL